MFDKPVNDRISAWSEFRNQLTSSEDSLKDVCEFWQKAPYIPFNNKIDPHHQRSWPTPWEIIADNKYDDFTKAIMMGWTLKYSEAFNNSVIDIRIVVDSQQKSVYNIICVDSKWALNYNDNGPTLVENIENSFYLENLIELKTSR
jgi:hypothetical protein